MVVFKTFGDQVDTWAFNIISLDPPYGFGLRNKSHLQYAKALTDPRTFLFTDSEEVGVSPSALNHRN